MKLTAKQIKRFYQILNPNLERIEDFDTAVKLKAVLDTLESQSELLDIGFKALERKFAKKNSSNEIKKRKEIIPQLAGDKIIEGFQMVTEISNEEAYSEAVLKELGKEYDLNIEPIIFASSEEAEKAFGEGSRRLILEILGTIIKIN